MSSTTNIRKIQQAIWSGSLPLAIALAPVDSRVYDKTDTFYIHVTRLSYLPFFFPKLHAFYQDVLIDPTVAPHTAWLSFEGIPLKWHHPVGLLYDLFSGASGALPPDPYSHSSSKSQSAASPLPWRLTVHYSDFPSDQLIGLDAEGKVLHDSFINSVKEADFLRNGTANAIMKLGLQESRGLWESVVNHDVQQWTTIYSKLLPQSRDLRHIPLRVYLPTIDPISSPTASPSVRPSRASHLRVVQSLIPPFYESTSGRGERRPQTLGTALHSMMPALFPSRTRPHHARAVLHGAVVPLDSSVEELMRVAAYADGWVSVGVEMIVR